MAVGWQPIETAPKDGTVFLGWMSYSTFPVAVCWERPTLLNDDGSHTGCEGAWVYADWLLHNADDAGIDPMFWMPSPTAPRHPCPVEEGAALVEPAK